MRNSIVQQLTHYALVSPEKTVFVVLENGEDMERKISYASLWAMVKTVAADLTDKDLTGKRALLVYQDIMEFIIAFLACQYAGIIPVPVPYIKGSKQFLRLMNILEDADPAAVLSANHSIAHLQHGLSDFLSPRLLMLIATDVHQVTDVQPVATNNDIAFIQYTSGSTGKPKGVMITHQNLMSNQAQIQTAFGCDEQSVIFSWLPFHHDMGLIGNILHTIYVGCTGILMSPFHFIQRPGRWLEGIGKYKATHSGAPNFAYDLCVNKISPSEITSLDLFSWKVAFNGSEPIRADTIQQFSDYFKEAGFNENSFYPCYGMAEATLMVSGYKTGKPPLTIEVDKKLVSSGSIVPGMSVKILNGADLHECGELEAGEVYISGDNVTSGYWNKDNSSLFHQIDHQLFFPTGDLGFFYKNEIFIHGRLKEMLIIRGENIYPYDIEQMIAKRISVVEPNGVAVFSVNIPEEACVVVAEIKRTSLKDVDVFHTIRLIENEVIDSFGIVPHDILLINPLGIPRTTSGKIQRLKCNENYVQQVFNVIGSREKLTPSSLINNDALLSAVKDNGDVEAIRSYLIQVIESKTGSIKKTSLHEFTELTSMGIDSLRAMELVNTVNKDLHINIDVTKVFQDNTLSGLIKSIEDVLWLKNEQTSGGEIII